VTAASPGTAMGTVSGAAPGGPRDDFPFDGDLDDD
jgi:hypothetical protein